MISEPNIVLYTTVINYYGGKHSRILVPNY